MGRPDPQPGDVLGDRYVLRKQEWNAPLGPVWLARDRVLDRAVFVQMLSTKLASDAGARRSFQKAAARIAQVTHPGMLQVFDIGDDPAFAVLEHAAGGRFADRLNAGPLRPIDAARAALSLARAIEALHERGSWHGSLSPENVLFDDEGRAKIMAVGTAAAARVAAGVDVASEQPKGYRPDDLDPLPADADRYALAALTYHMLTGRPPDRPLVPARQLRRDVSPAIDALLRRALDDQPANRPSLDEFVGALAPHVRVMPSDARMPRFAAAEFRWLVPVVLIVGAAVAVLVLGPQLARDLAGRGDDEPTPTATASASPAGSAVTIRSVSDFDPPPGNGQESPSKVSLAIDGDPRSAWATVGYASASLGGAKKGVGLLLDLEAATPLASVRVQSTLPGWDAEIRVAESQGAAADDYRTVTSFTAATETTASLPRGTTARYVLLWITKLVDDESENEYPFRAAVAEVELFAA